MKKVIIIIVIIAMIGCGVFWIINKNKQEKKSLPKPQKVEEDVNVEDKTENTPAEKAQKELEKHVWVGENKMGDEVSIYFNGETQTIEETLSNEYTTEDHSIDYSISEDGTKIIANNKELPFVIKGKHLYFDGVKYSVEKFEKPENQEAQ